MILNVNGHTKTSFGHTSLPLAKVPGIYRFQFKLDYVADTYLKLNQWEKVIYVIFEYMHCIFIVLWYTK